MTTRPAALVRRGLGLGVAIAGAGAAVARLRRAAASTTSPFGRSVRVWKLSVRNALRFAVTRARIAASPAERRAELDTEFAIRTAEDVARELGEMKGVLMKAGQLIGFVFEALPEGAQEALATLQSQGTPMAPTLAAGVVRDELGRPPERLFLDWTDMPVAAASIGQVHRAVARDGRDLAVKVQYPGVPEAIEADLDAVGVMYSVFASMLMKGLDAERLVDELRLRIRDEIDYRIEARNLAEFGRHFANHPWVRIPELVPELSSERVLTAEWVDGMSFDEFVQQAGPGTRQRAGEVIWRFAQMSIHRLGMFNGDPHPGNYRFHHDGSVTFLDFGLVKRWAPTEWESLRPSLDAIVVERDPERLVRAMEQVGFLRPGHGLDPVEVYDYVSSPYQPYLVDEFTFTRQWTIDTLGAILDVNGPHAAVIEALDMPASFVVLDRVVWGVSAILGKLEVTGPFRAMLLEYVADGPPVTDLGAAEAAWRAAASR
ncbi:MAG: ABC1 kinase family protein [Ilumatobacteraceae bacterium]